MVVIIFPPLKKYIHRSQAPTQGIYIMHNGYFVYQSEANVVFSNSSHCSDRLKCTCTLHHTPCTRHNELVAAACWLSRQQIRALLHLCFCDCQARQTWHASSVPLQRIHVLMKLWPTRAAQVVARQKRTGHGPCCVLPVLDFSRTAGRYWLCTENCNNTGTSDC
jgi:hypothetical protein